MRMLKPMVKQTLITALLGFVVHKLMTSANPRAKRIGERANKLTGHAFGPDERDVPRPPSRVRRAARSAATAAAGSAFGYFFDPVQGSERREKVKRFATERLHRNGQQHLLPDASQRPVAVPTEAIAPGVPS
jgi:hypothetical protein